MPINASAGEHAAATSSITIRAAAAGDIDTVVKMVNAAYRESEGHIFPGGNRTDRDDLTRSLSRATVAERHGVIVGCISIDMNGDAAHFGMLAAEVTAHRSGIGSMLITYAERLAREGGCTLMRIEAVKEGGQIPFYERRGYRVTRETPGQTWNGGADWGAAIPWHMVDMEKPL